MKLYRFKASAPILMLLISQSAYGTSPFDIDIGEILYGIKKNDRQLLQRVTTSTQASQPKNEPDISETFCALQSGRLNSLKYIDDHKDGDADPQQDGNQHDQPPDDIIAHNLLPSGEKKKKKGERN